MLSRNNIQYKKKNIINESNFCQAIVLHECNRLHTGNRYNYNLRRDFYYYVYVATPLFKSPSMISNPRYNVEVKRVNLWNYVYSRHLKPTVRQIRLENDNEIPRRIFTGLHDKPTTLQKIPHMLLKHIVYKNILLYAQYCHSFVTR